MPKNKISLKDRLYDFDQDMLHIVISQLLLNHPELETEIELIIDPNLVSNPFAFYKKMVVAEIKTHNYDTFPNKGIDGLKKCYTKFENLKNLKLYSEAWKLASAILFVIFRCEYSTKNEIELEELEIKVIDEISKDEFQSFDLEKIKKNWFKSMLINRYKSKSRQNKIINKFVNKNDKALISGVIESLLKI
jgi:hypothetical protein